MSQNNEFFNASINRLDNFTRLARPFKKHFTASAIVIVQSHILLIDHKRIGAWVAPGGHVEEYELPHETALRETKEETGLDISIISPICPQTKNADAFFLPEPLCMHAVKAKEAKGTFYHLDLAYLCTLKPPLSSKAAGLPKPQFSDEVNNACWVELDKLKEMSLANNVNELITMAKSKLRLTD